MDKLVSVIIPTFNREKTIARAIQSVLDQNYSNIEILVCDDKSTDKTKEVVRKIIKDNANVRLLSRSDEKKGANAARTLGLENAKGEYIAFLDSDDVLINDSISNRVNTFEENNEISLVYGDVFFGGKLIKYDKIQEYNQKRYLMEELSLCTFDTIMIRKEVLKNIKALDMELKCWQDDALILAVDSFDLKIYHCGFPVANMVGIDSGDRISANYYNLYLGLGRIIKQYKRSIIKTTSHGRYVLWKIRVLLDYFRYKQQIEKNVFLKKIYTIGGNICNKICAPFFRHIWG